MKSQYLSLPLLLLSATLALTSVPAAQAQTANSAAAAPDTARVIVRFKPEAASVRAKIMAARMSRSSAMDVAQTRATGLGMRTGLHASGGLRARLSLDERTHVFTASGIDSASLAKRLSQDSEIEMVAVDQRRRHFAVTPNDSLYAGNGGIAPTAGNGSANGQWYLKAPSAVPGETVSSINAPAAWDLGTGSSSVVVAVLDTGVRMDHPDLAGQYIGGYDLVGFSTSAGVATANDGNGADADASDPGDWVSQADIDGGTLGSGCTSADLTNSSWHGTRVSGLIAAASNNGQGIAGVAWGVKILPIRVLGKCGGYDSDIMAGMKWAAGISVPGLPTNPNPAKVLNLSLGGTGSCGTTGTGALYRDTITQVNAAKAIVVVAAGNSEGQAVGLPGNCPGVITVTGLRHVGSKVGFSSIGPEVAIAAPGGNCVNLSGACLYPMLSTTNSGTQLPVSADPAYTNNSSSVGTSFSAPIVAGTVALMASLKPSLTYATALEILQRTSRPFVSSGATAGIATCRAPTSTAQDECYCTTTTCGAGMLDAGAAVAATLVGTSAQTITFLALGNQVLGSAPIALTASASSGLVVSFASSTPLICSVTGSSLSLVSAGTCTVTATQSGNATYAAAPAISRSFSITGSGGTNPQTISFAGPSNQTFGSAALNLIASASSGLSVTFSSSSGAVCSVNGSVLRLLAAGTCTVTAMQTGNGSFAAAATVTRSFQVAQASQTIAINPVSNQTMGTSAPALIATASSNLQVTFASVTPDICSVTGTAVSLVAGGLCTITASQAGDSNYLPAASVNMSFTVLPAAQTITFAALTDLALGSAAPGLNATASSGLPVSFATGTPSICTVSGSTVTLVAAGTCSVTASQSGNGSFVAAEPVTRSFSVTPAPVSTAATGGGGGGGAFSALWVALLGLATWVLRRPQPQPLRA